MRDVISLCTPVMNRTDDLRRSMDYRIGAAAASPPVEFAILDYNSGDDLAEYVTSLALPPGVTLTYRRYTGREYWHTAHAYNLSILMSSGDYFALMGADTYPLIGYFEFVRQAIDDRVVWLEPEDLKGAIACRRDEFISAGGYDERFELYGPEDREMAHRLTIRGERKRIIPRWLMGSFHTPDDVKVANMRIRGDKHKLSKMMAGYYRDAVEHGVTVANLNRGWGEWN